jgi:hypothetical protein
VSGGPTGEVVAGADSECVSTTLSVSSPAFHPIGEPSAIVANVRVAEFMQQTHGLPGSRSSEFPAVDGDVGGEVGKQLTRSAADLF